MEKQEFQAMIERFSREAVSTAARSTLPREEPGAVQAEAVASTAAQAVDTVKEAAEREKGSSPAD